MNFLKKLLPLIIVALILIPQTRQPILALSQKAVIHSGIVDASTDSPRKDYFNYDFKITSMDGKEIDVKEFKGKTIFLNLWATWCGPCRAEMPTIQKLYESVDKSKIEFMLLSVDGARLIGKVKSYTESNKFTFPVYVTSHGLPDQLQVPSIPTTFIIDPNGLIVQKEVGMKNYSTSKFERFIESLSDKKQD